MSTTTNPISLPLGEVVVFLLAVALVIAFASWLIVRAHRRRQDRRGQTIWRSSSSATVQRPVADR